MDGKLVEVRQADRRPIIVLVRDELEIGRECDGLLLADDEVSRRHASLTMSEGRLEVRDLGSTNGTLLNGSRLTEPARFDAGDVVQLGSTELELLSERVAPAGKSPADIRSTVVRADPPAPATKAVTPAAGDAKVDPRQTSILQVAAMVTEDQPSPRRLTGEGQTITIVFSDIESSTERAMKLGDARWYEVLTDHNRIVRTQVRHFGGTEVKSQGDGFMLTFPSARGAVQCCIEIQRQLDLWDREHPDEAVRIRVGVHTGEAIVDDDGDLFGKHIIVAARIANLASGGEILASSLVREIASSRGDLRFGDARTVELKGIESSYQVHEVLWREPG